MKQEKIKLEKQIISFLDFQKTKEALLKPIGIKRVEKKELQVFTIDDISLTLIFEKSAKISSIATNTNGICVDTTIDILTDIHNKNNDFFLLKDLYLTLSKSHTFVLQKTFQGKVFIRKNSNEIIGSKIQRRIDKQDEVIGLNLIPNSIAGILVLLHEIGHSKTHNSEYSELQNERNAWAWALFTIKPFIFALKIKQEDLNCLIHQCCLGSYSKKLTRSF